MSHSFRAQFRIALWPLAFLLLITILPASASAQTPAPTSQPTVPLALPSCPAATVSSASPAHYSSQRKVILSWNASAPAQKPQNAVVGYCLYRSKMQNAAQLLPTCSQCEQINRVPVTGTSCVDDLVEDKATFYYVVTAVNSQGSASTASNEASAQIVKPKQSPAVDASNVPACRAAPTGAGPRAR